MGGLLGLPVVALHIPDGFLTAPVAIAFWAATIAMVGLALRNTNGALNERQIPLMGVMAAFIFAAQMLNFPVLGGTSGHLLGGALAAMLLGPWAGILVMACVIALQALLFQDGGLLAMGANIFDMGVVTAFVGGTLGRGLLRQLRGQSWGLLVSGFVAAWVSVMAAAALCALQLSLSGINPAVVFSSMLFVHAFIGVGEGLITVAALGFVLGTRPDLVPDLATNHTRTPGQSSLVGITAVGLLVAFGAALLSPFASGAPDGLERVADDSGFLERAQDAPFNVLPDYTIPGIDGGTSTIMAGVIGLLIVFALAYGIAEFLHSRRT